MRLHTTSLGEASRPGATGEMDAVTRLKLSPELALLFLAARTETSGLLDEGMEQLLEQSIDWQKLGRCAVLHGMMTILYERLKSLGSPRVPPGFAAYLKQSVLRRGMESIAATGEMLQMLDFLRSNGIEVVAFKGPMLAMAAYGNLAGRRYGDIDLLVHPADALRAAELFIQQGFIPRYDFSNSQKRNLVRYASEFPFRRPAGADERGVIKPAVNFDLHWNFFPPSFTVAMNMDRLWGRLEKLTISGRNVPTFATPDLILYLCLHGFAHHWHRLEWLVAVARTIDKHPDLDWPRLVAEAKEIGGVGILVLGLRLAHDWLGTVVPEWVLRQANSATSDRLCSFVGAQIALTERSVADPKLTEGLLFDWLARGNPIRRLKYFFMRAVSPSVEDLEWIALPRGCAFLYYFLRPLRLLTRRKSAPLPAEPPIPSAKSLAG